jgi:glycosyltransferase involved in cell wall biosynthesis
VGARCPSALRDLHDPGRGFHVVGYVDDVLPSIREADVFLMPLQMGGGTRLKALQAMASGLPVVSTAQGVEGLGVTPGREVSLGESGDALAAQCVRLLGDEAARRAQASLARKLVEASYGWEAIVDGIHADLVDLVSATTTQV